MAGKKKVGKKKAHRSRHTRIKPEHVMGHKHATKRVRRKRA